MKIKSVLACFNTHLYMHCDSSVLNKHLPTCRRILTHLQKTTIENILTKVEIAHDKNALPLSQGLHRYLEIVI